MVGRRPHKISDDSGNGADGFFEDVPETRWPESLPSPEEANVLSVVCGNTTLQWGVHAGSSFGYTPTCCWKLSLIHI